MFVFKRVFFSESHKNWKDSPKIVIYLNSYIIKNQFEDSSLVEYT
jgi:hypothetical protein